MHWDVVDVQPETPLSLLVTFRDGIRGKVTFQPKHLTGVFTPLRDPDFFMKVFLDHGTVAWPGDVDLAPDSMYREIREKGEWILA